MNDIAHALERFFTTKPAGKGTGLGLSQVYGFITQPGVTSSSRVRRGGAPRSTFTCRAEPPEVSVTYAKTKIETVLLLVDEPDVLGLATEMFRNIGYETVEASSASDAAAILRERSDIDVVFTDITMPHGMSDMELARLVRSRYPRIKVVLTSGYPFATLRQVALNEFAFVYKPYRLANLARAREPEFGPSVRRERVIFWGVALTASRAVFSKFTSRLPGAA